MMFLTPRRIWRVARHSPFVRHNLVFFFGSVAVGFLNYLYYPVLGRMLTPRDFGEVQALISMFLQALIFLQVISTVTVYVTVNYDDDKERNQVLFGLEKLATVIGLVLSGLLLVFAGQIAEFLQFESSLPITLISLAFVLSIVGAFRIAFLRGKTKFSEASISGVIGAGAKVVFSALFVLIGWRVFGAIAGVVAAQIIALFYTTWQSGKYGLKGFGWSSGKVDLKALAPQLKYSLLVFVVSLSVMTFLSIDILAAKRYLTPDDAGQYAGIVTVARSIFFITASFTGVMLSLIKINQSRWLNRLRLLGSAALTIGLGGAVTLFIYALPELTIQILVGGKYLEYAPLLPRLSLAVFLVSLLNLVMTYNMALRRYVFGVIALAGVAFLLLNLLNNSDTAAGIVNSLLYASFVTFLAATLWTVLLEFRLKA